MAAALVCLVLSASPGAVTCARGGAFPHIGATRVTTGPAAFQYTTASVAQVVGQIDGLDLSHAKGIDLVIRTKKPTQLRLYLLPRSGPAVFRYLTLTVTGLQRHLVLPISAFDEDPRAAWQRGPAGDSAMIVDCPGFFRRSLTNQVDLGPITLLAQAPPMPKDEVAPDAGSQTDPLYRRLLGGWLGKASGLLVGAAREGQTTQAWAEEDSIPPAGLGRTEWGFGPDDHCSFEVQHLLVVERKGAGFTSADLAGSWVTSLSREYLWKSERYALKLAAFGLVPPRTGENPHGESICARIRADLWGFLSPADTGNTLAYVGRDAPIGNCREGIRAAELAATMVSLAFHGGPVDRLVSDALAAQPVADSAHATMVRHCLDDFQAERPLRAAFERLDRDVLRPALENDPQDAWVSALPNSGLLVLALLYGRGDFARTVALGSALGWDSDCNAGTAGCILGVLGTDSSIPARFKDRLHDRLRVAVNGREHWSIRRLALETRRALDLVRPATQR